MGREVKDEEFQQHKAKYPRAKRLTVTVEGDRLEFVVRPPSLAEFNAFKALNNDSNPERAETAKIQLWTFCSLSPDPKTPELRQIVEVYPGLPDTIFTKALGKLAGLGAEVELGD